jgi:hypothetical protein
MILPSIFMLDSRHNVSKPMPTELAILQHLDCALISTPTSPNTPATKQDFSRAKKKTHKHEREHQTLILLSRTLRKPLWGSFNSPLLGPLQTQGVIKKEPRRKFLARYLEFFLPGICISLPDTWNNLPES